MKKIKQISLNSLLGSFSLILAHISHHLKVVPGIPMITLDFSDVPIFVSTLLFNSSCGYIILILVSIIRSLLFSSAGWPGVIMRISVTSVSIFFLSLYKKKEKFFWLFGFLASVFSTIVKLPVNYFFWTKFFSMSHQYVISILFSVVAPVNFVKMLINIEISYLLCKKIKFKRY